MMKKLKDRWHSMQGQPIYDRVIKCISDGKDLDSVPGLTQHEDRWDLRGITFPLNLKLTDYSFKSIDFSYSTLYSVTLRQCRFDDLVFSNAKLDGLALRGCQVTNTTFQKTSMIDVVMNAAIGSNRGSFINVKFIDCNMQGTMHYNTLFSGCTFENCKLKGVNFAESRFENCSFVGLLDEVFFSGQATVAKYIYEDKEVLKNEMVNVDFTRAILDSVGFLNGIDLSRCLFPDSDPCIYIRKNRRKIFEKVRAVVNTQWEGMNKKIAISLIDNYYLGKAQIDNEMDFINKYSLANTDKEFGDRFFELIKSVANDLNV
jgi:uncharacterized protein YjbI with pentapeptide repeats